MLPPVSNSEIQCFVRCRRKWYLQYVLWLATPPGMLPPTGTRELGLRIHQALETDVKTGREHGPVFWVKQIYGAALLEHASYSDDVQAEQRLAETMVEGYVQWAAETGLDEGTEVIAAEQDVQVAMPLMNGITLRGRLDQIIRRTRDGAVLFRDWKTTGNLNVANDLQLATQPRFYTMLQRLSSNDMRVDGGQFVYLLRSKRTARATPPFYSVEEVRYSKDTLNSTFLRTKRVIVEMMRARSWLKDKGADHREIVYPSPQMDCSWSCPFVMMCPLMDSGDRWQDMARGEYIQEDPYAYYDRKPAV